ncbi:ABC transporter [Aspergillus arachidicola]|uniref:ABC transporter n=1 Tax=Aspergillus arachidicola TaxID=656916 RepID=A0A2G7FX70_9EURO|nr:ABC transporter [Aspergillus arachidicola]
MANTPSIQVKNLSYQFQDGSSGLADVSLDLPAGSRTLLIGANGAGKTTLLRLLAGKRLAPDDTITVGGKDPFKEGLEGVTYLGVERERYPERRDELVDILDIDLRWRMHAVSDGERRRVQLAMGLLRPWQVLLLDEITVDLDLLSRHNFLSFLKRETETRPCTIVYATHILDNLSQWPTHLVHMNLGNVKQWGPITKFQQEVPETSENSQLGELVLRWLKEDLKARGPRNGRHGQAKTYESFDGMGGYGFEKRN